MCETVAEYYAECVNVVESLTGDQVQAIAMTEMDSWNEFFGPGTELGQMLGIPEGYVFDGSEEAYNLLLAYMGINTGTADMADYDSWEEGTYVKTVIEGITYLSKSDKVFEKADDGKMHLYLYSWYVELPSEENPEGFCEVQVIDGGAADDTIAELIENEPELLGECGFIIETETLTEYMGLPASFNKLALFSKSTTKNLQTACSVLKEKTKRLAGKEATIDVSYAQMRANLLNDGRDTRSDFEKEFTALDGLKDRLQLLIDQGDKLPEGAVEKLTEYKEFITKVSEIEGFQAAAKSSFETAELAATVCGMLSGKFATVLLEEAASAANDRFEEKNGIREIYTPGEAKKALKDLSFNLLGKAIEGKVNKICKEIVVTYGTGQVLRTVSGTSRRGSSGSSRGGRASSVYDPSGIVYEAVLSNPVEGAKATIWERNIENGQETLWDAEDYGQVNPQTTGTDGKFHWDVPEGEWQVRIEAPEGSVLSDNTSADHSAANLGDGSEAGWLPVMPIQLGINIPLVSSASPVIESICAKGNSIELKFSLYMDISELGNGKITVSDGSDEITFEISYPDMDTDPLDSTKQYARTVVLIPSGDGIFEKGKEYIVNVTADAVAYNGKMLSGELSVKVSGDAEKYRPGDIDMNGETDASDLTKLARIIAKIDIPDAETLRYADVNGDGEVNAEDLTKLARIVAKIDNAN